VETVTLTNERKKGAELLENLQKPAYFAEPTAGLGVASIVEALGGRWN